MKVAHVVRQFVPSVGGLEAAVLGLARAQQMRGLDVRIVTLDRIRNGEPGRLPAREVVNDLVVQRLPFRGSWRYPLAPGVLGAIRDADLVHVHGIDFFFDFLALTSFWHRKPLVASTHGGFFHTPFAQRLKRLYFATVTRASARAYRAVLASSESDFDLFRPIRREGLVLAPNGVDLAKWSDRASPEPVRRLISIGRFSSNKNLPALIATLGHLKGLHPAWELILAGRPWDVGLADLKAAAERAEVSDSVTVLEAPDESMIANAMARCSYIASASRHEGFGISVVEGLSAGLVPVLSPIPAFQTLTRQGDIGLLTDFDDPVGAATAIETLHGQMLRSPSAYRSAARQAAHPYSAEASATIVDRVYARAEADAGVPSRMVEPHPSP